MLFESLSGFIFTKFVLLSINWLLLNNIYIFFSGEKPIQATCKLNTGTTIVGQEIHKILEACEGDGCRKITFDYGQSISQMKTLIDISQFCHQTLSFQCFGSPLKVGSKNIGYWLDRQGKLLFSFKSYFLPLFIFAFTFE